MPDEAGRWTAEHTVMDKDLEIRELKYLLEGKDDKIKKLEEEIETQGFDKEAVCQQLHWLKEFKQNRNDDTIQRSLASLKDAALSEDNLMPYIINAVKAHATLGEISDSLRSVFGEY